MRIAVVHYHLKRGGVTRVIASALKGLGKACDKAVVISSTHPDEPLPCPVAIVPELAYTDRASGQAAEALTRKMRKAAHEHLGRAPDLWHVHNHSLGKNVNFPEGVKRLVEDGERLLLQIHDFAEDGRPANYRNQKAPYEAGIFTDYPTSLFPVAPQIGYAVLNGRDHGILQAAGVPESSLFWLPNAVTGGFPAAEPGMRGPATPLVLYPTRGIRRKNLGELLLMAKVYPENKYATTLTPDNPHWRGVHDHWMALADELNLPVSFGIGERPGADFGQLVASSTSLVTTSVAEGFGLAFLEPWLFGKPVIGRDLPEITGDFKNNGIRLDSLYPAWRIPCRCFDEAALRNRYVETACRGYSDYGREVSDTSLAEAWDDLTREEMLDFGCMDEQAQEEVLRAADPRELRALRHSGEPLVNSDADCIRDNAALIRKTYGLEAYGQSLMGIYTQLREAPVLEAGAASAASILQAFMEPQRLRLLRA